MQLIVVAEQVTLMIPPGSRNSKGIRDLDTKWGRLPVEVHQGSIYDDTAMIRAGVQSCDTVIVMVTSLPEVEVGNAWRL